MKNNKKETAVEWLYGVFELHAKGKREAPNWWDLERAIHMEKDQIILANEDCSTNELGEFISGEEYYNETYGK